MPFEKSNACWAIETTWLEFIFIKCKDFVHYMECYAAQRYMWFNENIRVTKMYAQIVLVQKLEKKVQAKNIEIHNKQCGVNTTARHVQVRSSK